MSDQHLAPPRPGFINPEDTVPLSPPHRPPFAHYHSSTSLPATPRTPYPPSNIPSQPTSSSTLTPYLTLPPRLLLTTLSPALLPLILTIAHLIANRSSTASLASSLKSSVLSACAGLATGAASLQTMPRYLAMQTNAAAIQAGQATIIGIGTALMDVVTILEVVLNFMVDTYRSMLMCTIELAVRGTLEILIGAVQTISGGVTDSLNAVRTNIQSDISSANNVIQQAVAKVNTVTSNIGVTISVPTFSVPSLTSLENVTIPTGFEDTLIKLNNTLPSLDDLRDKIDSIIDTPFELLKSDINSTRLEIAVSFNASALPVPSLSSLAASQGNSIQDTLCSDLDTSLIDDTAKALHKVSNVAIGLMFFLLFLVWGAMCFWEWRKWRAMKETVATIEDEWARTGSRDPWRVVAIVEHPVLERYGTAILHRLTLAERTRTNIRWYLGYLAHPTCLALLFIALLGFLSLQFQILALNAIKSHARENANATVAASTSSLTAKLNDMALNESRQYALEFNNAMTQYQQRINDDLFGSWFNTTAVTLNATLVEFYNGVEQALNLTFGGTILYGPVNTFIYCILGSKITNLEQGLTWLQANAHVTLPMISDDVLTLSNDSMNELVAPISSAAVGSSGNSTDDGIVGTLIDHFEQALVTERNFYAILLGVWIGFALIGLAVVMWHSGGRERYLAYRGRNTNERGDNAVKSTIWPWTQKSHPIYDGYTEKERQFRGISPSPAPVPVPVPRIVEPGNDSSATSFFDPRRSVDPIRPITERKGTFGSTFSSLAAPGQAFLKMTNRSRSDDGRARLVEGGASSEKYNSTYQDSSATRMETPPPFWVNKFYRAVENAKAYFPTRGQRLGAELMRGASQRTERSFGASQVPTPVVATSAEWRIREPSWTMIDPRVIGRDIDGSDSRYPILASSSTNTAPHPVYPRPMSRAPTIQEGTYLTNPFQEPLTPPPPLPTKHDSIDYLQRDNDDNDDADEENYHARRAREELVSPSSSSTKSYWLGQASVQSAARVQTGTSALATILANMERRQQPTEQARVNVDPFVTPFDDEHESGSMRRI
ncbi:hypothetical protein BCR39DRAFT_582344 [Naematelia encephala]|uniref:Plasma membrane fusion protein PRM1 n=1 Tax=Naematelia encephala TaxID=71784 RepID=A0A1Y2ANU9_9TREE|nr:hypothetical protein BCR39DRAFT_582344 [Naematelia encephala]